MAPFYGTVQGHRGEATRLGHGGLLVTAQSYAGDIVVRMHRDKDDVEHVTISCRPHDGGSGFCLYDGKVADLRDKNARAARLQALGIEEFMKAHEEANKDES